MRRGLEAEACPASWEPIPAGMTVASPPLANFQSSSLRVSLHPSSPAFAAFGVDGLATGQAGTDVILPSAPRPGNFTLTAFGENIWRYFADADESAPAWEVIFEDAAIVLRSRFSDGETPAPFVLSIDQRKNHATVLGLPGDHSGSIKLPALLHLPDCGTLRITGEGSACLDVDARRRQPEFFVRAAFPPATRDQPVVTYRLEVTLVHPPLLEHGKNALYAGYRRNFLNLIQWNPRMRTLANNSSSDACGFCFWQYAELARRCPPLASGLTVLDLVRVSLERILQGGLTYGQAGYSRSVENPEAAPWAPPFDSLDTLPSLLIAASHYLLGSGDVAWANRWLDRLIAMAREMLAQDTTGNGLIKYRLSGNAGSWTGATRPANWWDTIGFGHEDAYSNALAYRACRLLAEVVARWRGAAAAAEFSAAAERIRASYYEAFYESASGLLAGWRSADGQRHDYGFTFVNGMAVAFGLVDSATGHRLMDALLAVLSAVGYDRFDLGLPGNLRPIRREDYTDLRRRYGGPDREDGLDAFQIYENGGATHCHAYWTVKALYRLGRTDEARKIFYPILRSFAAGTFQGFGPNGLSRDWCDWSGVCHGYEGFLSDGYLALLAVEDDLATGGPDGISLQ